MLSLATMADETFRVKITTNADQPDHFLHSWAPEGEATGLITLIHGYGEHGARYKELATFLNQIGFYVLCLTSAGSISWRSRRTHRWSHQEPVSEYDRAGSRCDKLLR